MSAATEWPVLKRYEGDQRRRVALPLGGIGTGTVSLGGRGDLRDWEVGNRPAKGFAPKHSFFALYAKEEGGAAVTRALEGPVDRSLYEGAMGATAANHGLPRFRGCAFEAAYPLGQVVLSDPDVPLAVRLQAFNPLIPGDAERSGVPVAILRYQLTNPGERTVRASVCGNVQNFIGSDGGTGEPRSNLNTFRTSESPAPVQGIFMNTSGVDPSAEGWGTLALAALGGTEVSYRTAWPDLNWGGDLLDFWEDFSEDGRLEERHAPDMDAPVGSLAVSLEIPPKSTRAVTFLLTWHFPNRMTWTPKEGPEGCCEGGACGDEGGANRIGNLYASHYRDAWDVVLETAAELPSLEQATLSFVRAFCASDLPAPVKEAALFNLSTLRSQTCFRTPDGYLFGWEGCHDQEGCCYGSCTHVWNYEQATAYLFGDLARGMREVEFLHATDDDGLMSFRVNLPLERARGWQLAAADGQLGCLMKLYRDWQLSGDDAMLRRLWPKARRALEFCWQPGGWDADEDGVMEGCQHNTMDVEYYGPNPQMESWYLGALRAAEEMATYVGEPEFAERCRDLFERGRRWTDAHLFNGGYYEHKIQPPARAEAVAPGLRHESMGSRDPQHPDLQLGPGCLIDQLVGQFVAHVCGLGHLLEPTHVATTLQSLMTHNFKPSLAGHFNFMRSFALGDEAGMVMATYPRGRLSERPFPYASEVMTGFEYTAAVHMLYEGMADEGLRVIEAIRARYDGLRRNPFDEAECGHHYARAMASWGAVLALTGFSYSGVSKTMTFRAWGSPARHFWSNGTAWGTCRQRPQGSAAEVELEVLYGALELQTFTLRGAGSTTFPEVKRLQAGDTLPLILEQGATTYGDR